MTNKTVGEAQAKEIRSHKGNKSPVQTRTPTESSGKWGHDAHKPVYSKPGRFENGQPAGRGNPSKSAFEVEMGSKRRGR